MVNLIAVHTATPPHRYTTAQIVELSTPWLSDNSQRSPEAKSLSVSKLQRFAAASQIAERYFSLPLPEILAIGGLRERTSYFTSLGRELAATALRAALSDSNVLPHELTHLIFTSCTVPMIPALDVSLCEELGLSENIQRLPIFQYGCAGGAAALGLSQQLRTCDHTPMKIAVVNLELCSLLHQPSDTTDSTLVGATLFGDGVTAMILGEQRGPLTLLQSQSTVLPSTADLLGYDLHDDGLYLRLDRTLPARLTEVLPRIIGNFLESSHLRKEQIAHWLLHPGGAKILSSVQTVIGFQREQCHWSWDVLRRFGNTSSAAIGFVLDAFLTEDAYADGDYAMVVAIGPGVSIELSLARCNR